MCGICGIWYRGTGKRPSPELMTEMTDTMLHRGPDEGGQEIFSEIGLGHRRLRIIDLSTGQQPMSNEDGTVWVVFNGEIYNFKELKAGLENKGHVFRSNSDTEVLIHLYEEKGFEMPGHLRGMFAFAIWDDRRKKLFLCRDRLGIKPLYYYDGPEFFAFASELKAILPLFRSLPEIDAEAIADYFTFGYVPSPVTPFRGIRKLLPAEWLEVSVSHSDRGLYWDPGDEVLSIEDPAGRLAELVDEAVRIRLVSDVPFGAFLSGGVDSSTVCAHMQRHLSAPLKTFSIGSPVERYDELTYAKTVARHLKTDHHFRVVTPDAVALLPRLAWHFDEPFADSSAIPTWFVSELAREHVTMTHSGDGGDELFGGYTRYFKELDLQRLRTAAGDGGLRLAAVLFSRSPFRNNFILRMERAANRALLDPADRYRAGVGIFVNPFENILGEKIRGKTTGFFQRAFSEIGAAPKTVSLNKLGLVDIKTYLPEDILTKVDRMSMAHSLESRVPLLDHKLVEFAVSLDDKWKTDGGNGGKRILKELAATLVPRDVVYRPKKGFGVPLTDWFRKDLRGMMMDLHGSANHPAFDYLERDRVKRMIDDHVGGTFDHAERLWTILMFQTWMDTFVTRAHRYQGIG
ncbi:MAG: asparagine synthase (glutamine-hydrolyzing) [Deltaproteobacteria bacterium]|nr:asparagine synthase (glutamine-hydrolyzing) [Deltaproteobacteria bacterium]